MNTTVSQNLAAMIGSTDFSLKTGLWVVFTIAAFVYVLISLVFLYHWRHYALHNRKVAIAKLTYFVVSLIAIIIALFALIFI